MPGFSLFGKSITSLFSKLSKLIKQDDKKSFSIENMLKDVESVKGKKDQKKEFKKVYKKHLDLFIENQTEKGESRSSVLLGEKGNIFNDVMKDIVSACKQNGALPKDFDFDQTVKDVQKEELLEGEFSNKEEEKDKLGNLEKDTKINGDKSDDNKEKIIDPKSLNKDDAKKANDLEKTAEQAAKKQEPKRERILAPAFSSKLLQLAEKKFGKLTDKNRKDIENYLANFDLSKDEYKQDVKDYLGEVVNLPHNQNETLSSNGWQMYTHDIRQDRWGYQKWMTEDNPKANSNALDLVDCFAYPAFALDSIHARHSKNNEVEIILPENEFKEESAKPYGGSLDIFYKKYNIHINHTLIQDILDETKKFGEGKEIFYRKAYLDTFIRLEEKMTDKDYKIHEFMQDYENVMQSIIKEDYPELNVKELKYGGMQKDEMKKFLSEICEVNNNVTKKSKAAIDKEFGDKVPTVKEIVKYSKDVVSKTVEESKDDESKLLGCVGQLSVLQQTHMNRGKYFFLFHPFQNSQEKKAIENLKKQISDCTKNLSAELEAASKGEDVYKKQHKDEMIEIDKFAKDIDKEPLGGLANMNNEKNKVVSKAKEIEAPVEEKNLKMQPIEPTLNKKK